MKSLGLAVSLVSPVVTIAAWASMTHPLQAQQPLTVVYPPNHHETTADRIFLIGSAPPTGTVQINGQPIARSAAGHFAPSFPLQVGENQFTIQYQNQTLRLTVKRLQNQVEAPTGVAFAKDSLFPPVNLARQPNERICLSAIAPVGASVLVKLADRTIPLMAQSATVALPSNLAVLTQQNQPQTTVAGSFQGCFQTNQPGDLGQPTYQLTLDGQTISQAASGRIRILDPAQLEVVEVTAEAGVARTGPSTDYSRLTPLPKGSRALITGGQGDWLRLDYGAWINRKDGRLTQVAVPPTSIIRSIKARQISGWTEVVFPLQEPVPIAVQQGDRSFTLTLYNTTAQTDIIKLDDDPLIARLDWQQVQPDQIQYRFNLKTAQQWGYTVRYEGTSLVLALRHPPVLAGRLESAKARLTSRDRPSLQGITILLDPGHGGPEDTGAVGPTGYPEKAVALTIAKLLRAELSQRGATVVLTRDQDRDLPLKDRIDQINQVRPTLALSLHYNALPDNGDALQTQGIGSFWYHPQAHSLAVYLHNYLVQTLNRPSYGVFWNNLALTRPTVAPAVLLELGFMINPDEFEWITKPQEQRRLAAAIAEGVTHWLYGQR